MSSPSIESLFSKTSKLISQNKHSEAIDTLKRVCKKTPDNEQAWMMLGNLYGATGQIMDAEHCCRRAIELNASLVNAHANLGNALLAQNKYSQAAQSFTTATELQPDLAPAWYMLANSLQKLGKWPEAEAASRRAIALKTGWLDAHLQLGNILQALGRSSEAVENYKKVLQHKTDHAEPFYRLAVSLVSLGQTSDAETQCRKALEIQPDHVPALNSLAMLLTNEGRTDEAIHCCSRALERNPDDINAACLLANIYERGGDIQKAYEIIKPLLDANISHINLALAFASVGKELGMQEAAIKNILSLLEGNTGLPTAGRRNLHFNLGKLYDSLGQYEQAFNHYQQGNTLRETRFDKQKHLEDIKAAISLQSANFLGTRPVASNVSGRPVFIVGMPRSGTSLIEQILASHPQIFGAGEIPYLGQVAGQLSEKLESSVGYPEVLGLIDSRIVNEGAEFYLKKLDKLDAQALRVTDKTPGNFFYLGLVQSLFPDAKVIHCTRNPLDSCLSCYFQDFFQRMDWCYDLENLAAYYKGYTQLMEHWKSVLDLPILDVRYEDLVNDQENKSRELVKFLELDWSDDCLSFHQTKRTVLTASYDQTRKPIYTKSLNRWKNYKAHIGPLINALGNT